MVNTPQLSVVVPVFNAARYLGGCLDSVARAVIAVPEADRDAVEVIVCDNWSTDGSREIGDAARFGCSSRVIQPRQHESNRTRNWRAGFDAASGAWTMMLHADDLMAPAGLSGLLKATKDPAARRAGLIVGRHRTFEREDDPSELHPRWVLPSLIPGRRIAQDVLPYHCPFVPFTLMRKELYEAVGGLDERWELVQDWELWMRMTSRADVLFVPSETGWWRIHASGPQYQRLNAREHLALAANLERSVGALPAGRMSAARSVALARAAMHLDGAGSANGYGEDVGALPTPDEAAVTLQRMRRRIAAVQAATRAVGVPRWIVSHVRG